MDRLSNNNLLGTLGPKFSFHDVVRKEKINYLPFQYFDSFEDIFEALQSNQIQVALIAVKNAIYGKIDKHSEVISRSGLEVIENFELRISLHLAAKTSVRLTRVKKIYAHPVAWDECQSFLKNHRLQHINSSSNSQALIDLKNDPEPHTAAISGREAINQSALKLICENIQDHQSNITTFSLVTKGSF